MQAASNIVNSQVFPIRKETTFSNCTTINKPKCFAYGNSVTMSYPNWQDLAWRTSLSCQNSD
jgi:hypothetical protein